MDLKPLMISTWNPIDTAVYMAAYYHQGQRDKQGKPYIQHVLAVAAMFEGVSDDAYVVAILHDIVGDTDCTIEIIYEVFGDVIGDAVKAITKARKSNYFEYITSQVTQNFLATVVKLADLEHNFSRLRGLPQADRFRLRDKYYKAISTLIEAKWKYLDGDPDLPRIHHKYWEE